MIMFYIKKILSFKIKKDIYHIDIPSISSIDLSSVQRAYARLFGTEDGKIVLEHLQRTSFMRALPMDSPDHHIRYAEGQRAMVSVILRHIVAGRHAHTKKV